MARYGKIETGFWRSTKVRRLSQDAKYLMLYLLSCPHGNAIGCFVLHDGYIGADLGWPTDSVTGCLQELITNGLVERDAETSLLRIMGWWGHNGIESPNAAKHVAKEIAALPACKVKANLIDSVFNLAALPPAVTQILSQRFGRPFRRGFEGVGEQLRTQEHNITLPNMSESSAPAIAGAPATEIGKHKRERGTRIDPDWQPSEENRRFARALGFTVAEVDRIHPAFVDYWASKAGSNAVKLDWSRTWNTWMRREAERTKRTPMLASSPSSDSVDWERYVADYQASGDSRWPYKQLGPQPGYAGCGAPADVLEKHGYKRREGPNHP